MHSCWGLKAKRPIGEPGNRGAGGDQFTPGRGIRVQVIVSLTPWESQSLLQGAFPIPPDRVSQPPAGADQLGATLPVPRALRVPDLAFGTVGVRAQGRERPRGSGVRTLESGYFPCLLCFGLLLEIILDSDF